MRVLVDSSVWLAHFHKTEAQLVRLLMDEEVLTHPFVVGEIALADLLGDQIITSLLNSLQMGFVATHAEVMQLIELRQLKGRALGYVHAHLLASALLTPGATLWTRDPTLLRVVKDLGLEPPLDGLRFLQEGAEGYRQA